MNSYNCCNQADQIIPKLLMILKLLADQSRLKILCLLQDGAHCVCELEENLNLSQSLVSHHLADLKTAGLLINKKKGKFMHYKLTAKGKKVIKSIYQLVKE